MVTAKDAARRIREHNKIHQRAEPRNSPIITEILEVAAVLFEKIGAGEYQPVRHGKWEIKLVFWGEKYSECSYCGYDISDNDVAKHILKYDYKYCPHCGAKMDGDADDSQRVPQTTV